MLVGTQNLDVRASDGHREGFVVGPSCFPGGCEGCVGQLLGTFGSQKLVEFDQPVSMPGFG